MKVIKNNGSFKIWMGKENCFMCELVNGQWQDCTFITQEDAELEIERTNDYNEAVEQSTDEAWENYSDKWGM